jgi:hypothetical protein
MGTDMILHPIYWIAPINKSMACQMKSRLYLCCGDHSQYCFVSSVHLGYHGISPPSEWKQAGRICMKRGDWLNYPQAGQNNS